MNFGTNIVHTQPLGTWLKGLPEVNFFRFFSEIRRSAQDLSLVMSRPVSPLHDYTDIPLLLLFSIFIVPGKRPAIESVAVRTVIRILSARGSNAVPSVDLWFLKFLAMNPSSCIQEKMKISKHCNPRLVRYQDFKNYSVAMFISFLSLLCHYPWLSLVSL